jgi:hypothetical protein
MTEKEAYLQKLEAEKRQMSAKLDELQAQADIDKTDEALAEVTGAKRRQADFDRGLAALRQADEQDFERLKAGVEKLRVQADEHLAKADSKGSALREGYRHKREAELRELGSQFDQHVASFRRGRAEDSLLTRQEVEFFRRGFVNTGALLKRLVSAKGKDWQQAKAEYESSWRDLIENSRRIRADSQQRSDSHEPPPAHS